MGDTPVHEGLAETLVGICEFDVLADDSDPDIARTASEALDQIFPLGQISCAGRKLEVVEDSAVHALGREVQGDFIHGARVHRGKDGPRGNRGVESDLGLHIAAKALPGATQQHVGLNSDGA